MTRYFPATHDPILRQLFQAMLSDDQIGERMGLHWQVIRRNRLRLGLGSQKSVQPAEPVPASAYEPTNPVLIARQTLGSRATERSGGYFLDGRPVSAPDLVREANRKRVAEGQQQIGPRQWRVP